MENRKAVAMTLELKSVVQDVSNLISNFKAISSCFTTNAYLAGLTKEQSKFGRGVLLFLIFEGICTT